MFALELLRDCGEVGIRGRERDARPQSRHNIEGMISEVHQFLFCKLRRNPNLNLAIRKLKSAAHDADDHVFLVTQRNFFSQDLRVAAKLPEPEPVTQNSHVARARDVVLRLEIAPEFGRHPENRKKICRHASPGEFLRLPFAGEIERPAKGNGRHVLEYLVPRFPFSKTSR